ncbi:hypothetical protein NBRC116188_17180 [Oceaniserpentilla sp. 4NH20-0058]|uniref:hypothetical protein n=1 Tax=Oceaniserpentilla sp. 4NH20-0058 TaxID=3127660 RepID=UPI00310C8486
MINAAIPLLILLCILSPISLAGTLDDLEDNATKPVKKSSESSQSNSRWQSSKEEPNSLNSALAEVAVRVTFKLIEISGELLLAAGMNSQERYEREAPVSSEEEKLSLFRKEGDPLLPTFGFSAHWLNANSNIKARYNRVEVGYGLFGVSYTQNTLNENGDKLTLTNTLLHYRMSAGNHFSWDLAYGKGKMNGNQTHDGDVFSMPLRARFNRNLYLEYVPTWSSYNGGEMSEHQYSINWHQRYTGLSIGYKKWSAGITTVSGIFTGFNISF